MEILFKKEIIGKIENIYNEQFWMHGEFVPDEPYFKYKELFDVMMCEEGTNPAKFNSDFFDENNWSIKNGNDIQSICIPAIYEDGYISIRYR